MEIIMNAENQFKLDVVVKVLAGRIDRKRASEILEVSQRTFERYLWRYNARGPAFVRHGNKGRRPWNRTNEDLRKTVQNLIKTVYHDFNLTHLQEKLEADHQIYIKRETLRKWAHQIEMVKRKKKRRTKARYHRQRMAQQGLMLQMDGSHHRWFGGKPSCLICAIDDATSEMIDGEFFLAEDTLSCMTLIQRIVEKHGLFEILYVDHAGNNGGQKRAKFNQMRRALDELGIHIIFANSPEAKGRIERAFETLQDRIIPELRLRKIGTFPAANRFLQGQYIPNFWNKRYKEPPRNPQTAFRPLPTGLDLKNILCLKESRQVNRDHTISWHNELYSLKSPVGYSIHKQRIELRTYQDLSWQAFYGDQPIELVKILKNAA